MDRFEVMGVQYVDMDVRINENFGNERKRNRGLTLLRPIIKSGTIVKHQVLIVLFVVDELSCTRIDR